jgi:hypothetical protein
MAKSSVADPDPDTHHVGKPGSTWIRIWGYCLYLKVYYRDTVTCVYQTKSIYLLSQVKV